MQLKLENRRYLIGNQELPTSWYNVVPDLPGGLRPILNPGTGEPLRPEDLAPLFPEGLIEQEAATESYIEIPQAVREVLAVWRPTPLVRARRLERELGTKSRIYYKYEGASPSGSHKTNTAVAQAYYNKREGVRRLATETGAGQWGSALAFAAAQFDLDLQVYMVRCSYDQKPYRRALIEAFGAGIVPSPSPRTAVGRRVLEETPDTPGSLGTAISEAVEDAAGREDTRYALGSVLNHVLLHQTVIGQEARRQLSLAEDYPDVIVGCCGGGSNFAGLATPFLPDKLAGRKLRLIGVEPYSCPTLTRGRRAYDFGDSARLTPLIYMHTLGSGFVPPAIHAGGLRYHGMAPIVSALVDQGLVEAVAEHQRECFAAGVLFARCEGFLPAPESTHAVRRAIVEATREPERPQCILVGLSGHGLLDLGSYQRYFADELEDFAYPQAAVEESLRELPGAPSVSPT